MRHELRIWITKQLQSEASVSHKTSFSNCFQQICMNHVIQINESCHTYEWAVSNMNESWHISMRDTESCRFEIFPHIWIGHVTHINESCHTHHWVMSQMNESCHVWMREWVMSRINMWFGFSSFSHTFSKIFSRLQMSRVVHINESCRRYEWVV